ncbi:hypothetical protein ACQR16_20200, partial [Bradyrhizobium oligotrophicum]|uniref:hypothetical protein n=1 Tax=Bradyrhizobium oligotrophicum TaxID=44255 RepID=UPI003EBE9F59
ARLLKKMQAAGTTGLAEHTRPSPRDGFTNYTYSPRCPGLLATVAVRIITGRLDASVGAPGPYDFTVLPDTFVRSR